MGANQHIDLRTVAASALDWWREAGVDASIDEAPRNWLAPVEPVRAEVRGAAMAAAVAEIIPLPDTLAAFEAWRIGADAPEAGWPGRPIAAQGSAASDIMVMIDLPEREDADTGILMSGAAGRLFDRMLAAIGRDRESIYLVPVCATRPVAGRVSPEIEDRLKEREPRMFDRLGELRRQCAVRIRNHLLAHLAAEQPRWNAVGVMAAAVVGHEMRQL